MSPVTVVVLIAAALAVGLLLVYNRLVTLRNRIDAAWADIDVHLRRRHDLIPNLVDTVKAYAEHERGVFEEITRARAAGRQPHDPHDQAEAEVLIDRSLRQLFAVAEAYPDLKADARFRDLQTELAATENKIAFSRQLHNDTVTSYQTAIQSFPVVLIAGPMGFGHRELFEADETERPGVSVDLGESES